MTKSDLFIGYFPGCIVYADRGRIQYDDYKTIAHLSYSGIAKIFDSRLPDFVREKIEADARKQSAEWEAKIDAEIKFHTDYIYEKMLDALKPGELIEWWTKRREQYATKEAACYALKPIYKERV